MAFDPNATNLREVRTEQWVPTQVAVQHTNLGKGKIQEIITTRLKRGSEVDVQRTSHIIKPPSRFSKAVAFIFSYLFNKARGHAEPRCLSMHPGDQYPLPLDPERRASAIHEMGLDEGSSVVTTGTDMKRWVFNYPYAVFVMSKVENSNVFLLKRLQ